MRTLIIEDNQALAANIGDYLEAHGHCVDFAMDGRHGAGLALATRFDAIVLDLMLPHLDGIDVCAHLRASGASVPILMLTARDTLVDRLEGFDAGTDDYLVKPFSLDELHARLRAMHRRAMGDVPAGAVLRVGDLQYDPKTLRAYRGGHELELRPTQRCLLEYLMRNAERVVPRQELETALWGDEPPDCDSLRAHIHLLREAVDRGYGAPLIHTVRGAGYRLAEPDAL